MALLSKAKIEELKKEYDSLKDSLSKENEEQVLRGGPMDSYKEAAAFSVSKQAKEARVEELKDVLKDAKELPNYVGGRKVTLGKWFKIQTHFGIKRYRLVDPVEADPSKALISSESPFGKAVIFKKTGDKIRFNTDLLSIIKVE